MKTSMASASRNRQALLAGVALVGVSLVGGAASAQSPDNYNLTVYVINNTSETLMEFYATNVDDPDFESRDLLGAHVIRPGNIFRTYIDDGGGYCLYDLKAVFEDGIEVVKWEYNVCEHLTWEIYD